MGRYNFAHLDKLKSKPLPEIATWPATPKAAPKPFPKEYRVNRRTGPSVPSSSSAMCGDTHPAAPHGGHVRPEGASAPPGLSRQMMAMILQAKEEHESEGHETDHSCMFCQKEFEQWKKAQVTAAAEVFAFQVKSGAIEKAADKLLKANGAQLEWKRGGKQIKIRDAKVTMTGTF